MPTFEEHINSILSSKYDPQLTPIALEQKRQLTSVLHRTPPITNRDELNSVLMREVLENRVRYQKFTEEYANLLNADIRSLNQKLAAVRMAHESLANVGHYAHELGQVANAASFCVTFSGSSKGPALGTLAQGAMSLSSACTAIGVSGTLTLGTGAGFAMGVMAIGQGLFGLFGNDDDSPQGSGLFEILNAIFAGLVQISQQINNLGKYIEARFNHLEKMIGTNHQVEMGILRTILFKTDVSSIQLKQTLQIQHGDVLKKIDKLASEIQTVLAAQRAHLESSLRHRYLTLQEFHFLQAKPERTIVNTVKQLIARNGINDANFVQYSAQLCQAITMESHGSDTLTGRDLRLDDMDAIHSRLINPLEKIQNEQDAEYIAAYNIDFLKNIAVQYGAVRPVDFPLPNLILFKDRCLAFYDWQYAYAEYKRDPSHRIPESAYQDLSAVIASISTINVFLHSIDLKKVMFGLSKTIQTDYLALKNQIASQIIQFELLTTKNLLTQSLKYVAEIEALLPSTQNSTITTVPESNTTLNIRWADGMASYLDFGDPLESLRIISTPLLAPLPVHFPGQSKSHPPIPWPFEQSYSWRINYKQFIENIKKLSELSGPVAHYFNPVKKTYLDIDLNEQYLGQTQQELLNLIHISHSSKIQALQTKIAAFKQEISRMHATASRIHIFSETEKNREILNSILAKCPRIIKPCSGLNLHLILDNTEIPSNLIPSSFFMAELLGIGKIELTYAARFSHTSLNEHVKRFYFSLKIHFLPNQQLQETIELFNGKSIIDVSTIYSNPEEMAYNYWYGLSFYNGELYDLSNVFFIHKNPFLKRIKITRPLFALQESSTNRGAEAIGNELIAKHLKFLHQQFNQNTSELFFQQKSPLQQSIFKVETSAILIQLFAGLCMPAQLSAINQTLSKIQGRKFSNYIERLQKDHASESKDLTLEMQTSLTKLEPVFNELGAIIDREPIGDSQLHFLHDMLLQYRNSVQPVGVVAPAVQAFPPVTVPSLAATSPTAGGVSTRTSLTPTSRAQIEALRSTITTQSQEMAKIQTQQAQSMAQNEQLRTEVHELKSMLASVMQLLTQQQASGQKST